jgi:hypothetical protein
MSDTSRDHAAMLSTAKPRAARVARPGELAWRLRHADGRVQSCELRNHSEAGAGWEVQVFGGGELLFGRPCSDERLARFAAEAMKQDQLRDGWIEGLAGEAGGA